MAPPLQWFDDAAPAVAHACNAAVSLLEAKGLTVVEIQERGAGAAGCGFGFAAFWWRHALAAHGWC